MKSILKSHTPDLLELLSIAILIGIFFFRFFWPEPALLVTPDFGRSDAWHFSFATKFALAESFKRRELPLWEPRMGMGFPLFAEGQVGALFLPNLLLMSLPGLTGLNHVTAYNLTYVIMFLTLGWGMYAWLRVIGCSRLAALFGSVTLMFSGQTIPRLPHHTLLQSLSLTPVLLVLVHLMLTRRHILWTSFFSIALSQQFFTGSPQPILLTYVLICTYCVTMLYGQGLALSVSKITRIAIGTLLGLGMAAIQILPSMEMLRESSSPSGFSQEDASYYSFPLIHLKTLVQAFSLGNPGIGTYPPFPAFDGSIFWENNLFVGWLPILTIFLFIVFSRSILKGYTKRKNLLIFFCFSFVISFLLMLGKYSPLYLLYSVWPLNLFRVPSRFAWIFLITLVSGACWTLTQCMTMIVKRRPLRVILSIFLIIFQAYLTISTWWNYHPIESAESWLTETPFIKKIQPSGEAIRTIGVERVHNNFFLKNGWQTTLPYQFLSQAPSPNGNIYQNITQTEVYAGRFLKRSSLVESLLGTEITSNDEVASISAQGKRLLDLYHVGIVVSALPLDMVAPLSPLASTSSGTIRITAYQNHSALLRAYIAAPTLIAPTYAKAAALLADPSFIPGKSVIVHDASRSIATEGVSEAGNVTIDREEPTRIVMKTTVKAPQAILVFGDTFYPGWQATIDGQRTEIFPVNIKERGIAVTRGSHEIIWTYAPQSVAIGTKIAIVSLMITVLLPIGYHALRGNFRTVA
ncbi:hypothetical protein HY949_00865 [Candidatus Gottesmanbacteria bacterium]|nr:hypothetical protein [Candidatus Gottesmanbacteria bacterium]